MSSPQMLSSRSGFSLKKQGLVVLAAALALVAQAHAAAVGYGKSATGGAGGSTVTVTTAAALISALSGTTAKVIQVSGKLNAANAKVGSNKTIIGIGTAPTIIDGINISGANNVIVQNLTFTASNTDLGENGPDGLGIDAATNVWIDHCTFVDCADGSLDIKNGADLVTVSWCKFNYTYDHGHNLVNLIGHSDTNGAVDTGKLHVTMHHNWYATLCKERMPRVRFGQVHVFNNYYGSASSNYNVGIGNGAQVLVQNCYFNAQTMPWKNYSTASQGIVKWSGGVFSNTTVPTWAANSTAVFTPSYTYTLDSSSTLKTSITNATTGAGAH